MTHLRNVLNSANLFDYALLANSVDWTLEDKNVLEEVPIPVLRDAMALQPRWLCFLLLASLISLFPGGGGFLSNLGSAELHWAFSQSVSKI